MRRYWAVVVFLVVAILLVALAITYGLANLGRGPEPAPEPVADAPPEPEVETPETRAMLVAAQYLPVGALLAEADVISEPLEVGRIPAGAIPADDGDVVVGTAVRVPIDAGTPVLFTDLVRPGARGFLSLILSPGMRAVSVNIGSATRHAGLIDPGDRVDVIFTASAPSTENLEVSDSLTASPGGARLSRTLFEDVRVLAIDRTVRPPAVGGEEPPGERQQITTATLEVSPRDAPILVHAHREGELALALRAARSAPDPAPPPSAVHIQELLLPDARAKSPPPPSPFPMDFTRKVKIFRPDSEAIVEFLDTGTSQTTRTPTRAPSPAAPLMLSPAPLPTPPAPPSEASP